MGTVLSVMAATKMKMGPLPIQKRVKERNMFFEISFKDYFLLNPLIFIIILVVFLLRK